MNRTLVFTLATAVTLCSLATAGCTSLSGQSAYPAFQQLPSASFNATPVRYAPVNGVMLGYREFGSGEPLLMVQGFGATLDDWNPAFIGILASKYHVYTFDYRGMGYSSDNNATPTVSQYADDAAALIPALGYDSMHVYGVSMGSSVAQQLVIDHPERVRKLVLDSNAYSIRIPETKTLLGSIEAAAVNPVLPEGVRREARAILAWNGSYDGLSGIRNEVMLVVGTEDVLTPESVSVRMAGQINRSVLVRFRGLPHAGSGYAPVKYGENTLAFLGKNVSSGCR
jgi:pimeloyl-ACP methyl ester carboxylesterase